ncbi:MAG: hypothetical protein RLZZ226_647 [Pseudomonadota bacterium]
MQIPLTQQVLAALYERGVGVSWAPGSGALPARCRFEPPCSIQWMALQHDFAMGAFSYGVSGYFFATSIGRYVSIGPNVQMGWGNHPLDWLSTSPLQYQDRREVINCGSGFRGGALFQQYSRFSSRTTRPPATVQPIEVGSDVWVGFGAFIKPGIRIGHGAVIGGQAVVTRDVPDYAIVAGNPARVKRMRFDDAMIERLLRLAWWQYPVWQLRDVPFDRIEQAVEEIEWRSEKGLLVPYQPDLVCPEQCVAATA